MHATLAPLSAPPVVLRPMSTPTFRSTWAEIDLAAIRHNVAAVRLHVGAGRQVMAVVKANGYGHGMAQVAAAALQAGATWLAVATTDEALELRETEGLQQVPLLVMAPTTESEIDALQEANASVAIGSLPLLRAHIAAARRRGRPARLHVQFDTGLGRDGFRFDDAGVLEEVAAAPQCLEGLFCHFAVADGLDDEDYRHTHLQQTRFDALVARARGAGLRFLAHSANSGAVLRHPHTWGDLVRPGMMLYGVDPAGTSHPPVPIRPALTLKSCVAAIRTVEAGDTISYGRTWAAPTARRIGVVPTGYGDGFPRLFSNRGEVLVRGRRAPIRGRVCMDQFMIDLDAIPEAEVGDEVVIYGAQGRDRLTLEEVAAHVGTIPYELACALSPRTPRVYRP